MAGGIRGWLIEKLGGKVIVKEAAEAAVRAEADDATKLAAKAALEKAPPGRLEAFVGKVRKAALWTTGLVGATGIGLWTLGSEQDPNAERKGTAQEIATKATEGDIKSGQKAALEEFRRMALQNGSVINEKKLDDALGDFRKANPKATKEQILAEQQRLFTIERQAFEDSRRVGGVDKLHVPNKPDEEDVAPGADFKLVGIKSGNRYTGLKIVPTMPNAKIDFMDGDGRRITTDGAPVRMQVVPVGKKIADAVDFRGTLRVTPQGTYIQADIDPAKPESAQFLANIKEIIVERGTTTGPVKSEVILGKPNRDRLIQHTAP